MIFFVLLQISFFVFGGERRCNSLADAVNLPCARSHSNALKLDAVLVDQCFTQCFVAGRGEKREGREGREGRGHGGQPTVIFRG